MSHLGFAEKKLARYLLLVCDSRDVTRTDFDRTGLVLGKVTPGPGKRTNKTLDFRRSLIDDWVRVDGSHPVNE